MARVNPYLSFNGNCREAMTFYKECLGGELSIMPFGGSPVAEGMPAELHDRVLHAMLDAGSELVLMGADLMQNETLNAGNIMTICLNSLNKEEIKGYYAKLSDGAAISRPLMEEFFGLYGTLTDRYGVAWMFQGGGEPD